jgi:LmbE family N-acetylglucosaminyl deacetylase
MSSLDISDLGTVLTVWAHPDDEAYLAAGLMTLARDAGQRVVCLTATRGEGGTWDPERWPAERLGRLRATELRASLAALGVTEHQFLGYTDGTAHEQDDRGAVARIAAVIDVVRPDTIVTFGPDGITGHSDHRTVSRWTTAAHALAAPDARLLHAALGPTVAERWLSVHADQLPVFYDEDVPVVVAPEDAAVHIELDEHVADRKLVALRAQASQTMPLIALLGEERWRQLWTTETFRFAPTAPRQRWRVMAGANA